MEATATAGGGERECNLAPRPARTPRAVRFLIRTVAGEGVENIFLLIIHEMKIGYKTQPGKSHTPIPTPTAPRLVAEWSGAWWSLSLI